MAVTFLLPSRWAVTTTSARLAPLATVWLKVRLLVVVGVATVTVPITIAALA